MFITEEALGNLFQDTYALIAHGDRAGRPTLDLADRVAHENFIIKEMMTLDADTKNVFDNTVDIIDNNLGHFGAVSSASIAAEAGAFALLKTVYDNGAN
jgi:hypothetical protein